MTPSQGEPPRGLVDRQWPHQLALRKELCTGQNYERPRAFCSDLRVYSLHPTVMEGDQHYLVFCFAEPEDAIQFKEAFNGIPFYPEDRRGKHGGDRPVMCDARPSAIRMI